MRLNKNKIETIILFVSAISLSISMTSLLLNDPTNVKVDSKVLIFATILVSITMFSYMSLILRRIKPKKYIYISCSIHDYELSQKIIYKLSDRFTELTRYRFIIKSYDTIPYGSDIEKEKRKFIVDADIVLVIVSREYINDEKCRKEFRDIYKLEKKIIPIITEDFSDLGKLPFDMSYIKALSLKDCETDSGFNRKISVLAKDLIYQELKT